MKIDVLTLFPEMFVPVTGSSILGRAAESGILEINLTDIRDFSNDKHNKADDYPFGGGGGMVMMADPVFGALESVEAEHKKVIYMSPRGRICLLYTSESADAGMGVLSAANAMGLDFMEVAYEEYDFAIPVKYLELPHVQAFIEILKSSEFREELERLGGYTSDDSGKVILV